ncbi:MAG: hypothetical protein Q8916_01040 [Bacteroidota bacterium]|nr:hypothetical protein [Bacteroidota bacterium]MDP4228972.1 hypothetical protein [Bacteroidota bacterium]MDP4237105.1 hypothetical protein [Bacteroidota bacterium]
MAARIHSKTLPREQALTAIKGLKKNASYDDIMYKMYVLQKIEKGEQDARDGKVNSEKEARKRLSKWLK